MSDFRLIDGISFEDTTVEDWAQMQAALGLTRGLLVNSMMYQGKYQVLLHALAQYPDRLRGVSTLDPAITDRELAMLDRTGVVGVRFAQPVTPAIDERLVRRVNELGWSVHYVWKPLVGRQWYDTIVKLPGNFVVEHMASMDPADGFDSVDFKFLLKCLDTGRAWVKLSPRVSREDWFPFSDVTPFIRKLVEYAPQRLLWGSDWPHPFYVDRPMPSDTDLLNLMVEWVPDERTRNRILVDNPAELFGFPAANQ